jgi:hypothetical protein
MRLQRVELHQLRFLRLGDVAAVALGLSGPALVGELVDLLGREVAGFCAYAERRM